MKKNAILVSAAMLLMGAFLPKSIAQRVDLDNKSLPAPYIQLPKKPLPADYTTYGTTISAKPEQLRRCNTPEVTLQSYLNLPGFRKLTQGGHFHVEVIIDDFVMPNTSVESESSSTKDKEGKVTTTTTYWVEAVYAVPVQLKVTSFQGTTLEDVIISSMEKTGKHKSKAFGTSQAAQAHWAKNRASEMSKVEQDAILGAFGKIKDLLETNYAYKPMPKNTALFQYVDSKKLPDFDGFEKAFNTLTSALGKMKYDEPLDAVKSELQPALDFWASKKDKYNAEDKQERKLKFACLYNLANACFWTEQFSLTEQYAKELIAMDYKEGKADNILEQVAQAKVDMERCGKTSRHFKAEASQEDIEAASEVEYQTEKGAKLDAQKFDQLKRLGVGENATYYEGQIVFSDERGTVDCGFFVDYAKTSSLSFLRGRNNIVAVKESDKGLQRQDIDPNKVEQFSFGDHKFRCLPYSPGTQISLNKNKQIMEVLYESEKIQLYQFYPVEEAKAGNTESELAYKKQSDKEFTSLSGLKFINWKKGLSKYFEDCQEVAKKAADGGFDRSENGAIEAAKAYSSCN